MTLPNPPALQPGDALLLVDPQNDFCPGGSLPVEGGDDVAARVSAHLSETPGYELIVATMDWHPVPGAAPFPHFAARPDYRSTWPVHCVQGTRGAELHPALVLPPGTVVVRKGQHSAAYSGFEGSDEVGRSLLDLLRSHSIEAVDVVGLATDHCVRATALDALAAGFAVRVRLRLVAGVAADTTQHALDELRRAGATLVE
jgi:nicotinamidase/pyrazinamidase